jgi:hypothetical protein
VDSQKARCYQGSPPSAAGRVKRWIGSGKLRRRFTASDIALTYNNTNILFFLHPKLENFNSASKFPTPNTPTPFLNIYQSVSTPQASSTVPTRTLLLTPFVADAPILALYSSPYTLGRHHQRRYQLQKLKVVSKYSTPLVQLVDHLLSLPVVLAVQERHYVLERWLWQINHFVMYHIILSFCSCSHRALANTFPVAVVREVAVY